MKLVAIVTQKRRDLIKKDPDSISKTGRASGMTLSQERNSGMIEREMKKLESIERKNQGEIQQIIDYELRMEATRKKAEENAAKQAAKEERRQKELAEARR